MKEKEREANAAVTVTMDELKKRIENLPENMVISVTMEDTKDDEKKGE
jgi:hypothetical protein